MTPAQVSPAVLAELEAAGLSIPDVTRVVRTALDEDLRYGPDATTAATVPADAVAEAEITPRKAGTLAGVPVALAVFDTVYAEAGGPAYEVLSRHKDGDPLTPGEPALVLRGRLQPLLTAERTALNLLCHLSGVASATAAWVRAVEGTGCVVRDTRKTMPGLRALEKYAVRCGGGANHRMGLGDAVLVKDNHVAAAGGVAAAFAAVRAHAGHLPIEIEVGDLAELDAVLPERPELVLLDNFTPEQCAEAVRRATAVSPGTKLEASGGLTLDTAADYARTGVHFVAVGGLTHSSPALDLGLDVR